MKTKNKGPFIGCGPYDPTLGGFHQGKYPDNGGTGDFGGIEANNCFDISKQCILGGESVPEGAMIRSFIDEPGQDSNNWKITFA